MYDAFFNLRVLISYVYVIYLHGQGCKLLCLCYDFEHIVLFQILNSVYRFGLFHIHTSV